MFLKSGSDMFILYFEGVAMQMLELIQQNCRTGNGRRMLVEKLSRDIEKAASILKMKYRLDRSISQNMDDIRQSFAVYLLEHESIWMRALSFEAVSSFIKVEMDYFIGEHTEKSLRSGYRTLSRWTREALKDDDRFDNREMRNSTQRTVLIFGLKTWEEGRSLFKEKYQSFSEFRERVISSGVRMSFNPVTQTKPDYSKLVKSGSYEFDIDEQIVMGSEVLLDTSGSWCSIADLISGFREFWLDFGGSELSSESLLLQIASEDDYVFEENGEKLREFLGGCSFMEVSVLKAFFSRSESFSEVAKRHGVSPSSVTEKKKSILKKISEMFKGAGEHEVHSFLTVLADHLDSIREERNE